jgi:O-acetyl-ADP-ribose deacetylase (regulator of RNase III)
MTAFEQAFMDGRVTVVIGDITQQQVGAIVNAANWTLLGGGGVDGAIHRAGGPQILAECKEIRKTTYPASLPPGEAVITTGGNLLARYVIHTVGPIYGRHDGNESAVLSACYRNSIILAQKHAISTIAFPAISTGVYGYPRREAAEVSSTAIRDFLSHDDEFKQVRLVFFQSRDARDFLRNQKFE